MSEKRLLEVFKSIILIFLTFTCFGPPIVSKIGNLNINDYFFNINAFMSSSNIEAESLNEADLIRSGKIYVPSIKIFNQLMGINNSKIYLNSPSEKIKKNAAKENSIAVRDRKKDLPKRADETSLTAPSKLSITSTTDANKTKEESKKETAPTLKGVTMQGASFR